jgi:tetratricopeptide (TPR) repeat protein
MRSKQFGGTRTAILVFLLFIGIAVKALFYFLHQDPSTAPDAVAPIAGYDAPPRTHGSALWLQTNDQPEAFPYQGIIAQELFRQAVLIAARDGLGLQTRDASLREWRGTSPPDNTLEMEFNGDNVILHEVPNASNVRWRHNYGSGKWPDELADLVDKTEKMSRDDFPTALHKDGWSGSADAVKPDAPAPRDSESRLMEMEELSQFAVLRETHAAIRSDGDSLARSGALVRAYANLGELTRYHWSAEYAVYTARSLLYAQRMVVNNPNSAFALWHRAYARAMAGLQGYALKDLAAAAQLKGENPPAWAILLEPFCRYQTEKLVNLATGNQKLSTLGMYLAFMSAEHSGTQGAAMNLAQAAFTLNPQCLRIVDSMCNWTGPGMLNELVNTGPNVFSQTLGKKLEKMPSFPPALIEQISQFKRPGGNPGGGGRQKICLELIDDGAPQQDNVEPSWAALGRLIQETTFAHVQQMGYLICMQWGVDASDYVSSVQASIADHPFKFVIDACGLRHGPDMAAFKQSLTEPKSILRVLSLRQIPLYFLEQQIDPDGPAIAQQLWCRIVSNSDLTAPDLETYVIFNQGRENDPWVADLLKHLRQVSPESPALVAADIRAHWDASKAPNWEADHGDYPTVALALGKKYTEMRQWTDAERCLRKYITVSPDYVGYEALSQVYKNQKMDDRWLATLNEYLTHGSDYGLQYANVQSEIAHYYMNKRDFKKALPYADAAASTASAWGLLCAADAHTGVGDWTTAEQLIVEAMNHYSESPYNWYVWCSRTGHGDIASAGQSLADYFAGKGSKLGMEDTARFAFLKMGQLKNTEALTILRRRMKLWPGPNSALHIAAIDDELHDVADRDAMLDRIQSLPDHNEPLGRFAALLRDAIKSGPAAAPDAAAIDSILKSATANDRVCVWAITGRFLEDRGHSAEAVGYFKRCIDGKEYGDDRLWVDTELRQNGQDVWALDQASGTPNPWN